MLLVKGIIYIVKLLVLHQIYWLRTAGQAAISNTDPKWSPYRGCQFNDFYISDKRLNKLKSETRKIGQRRGVVSLGSFTTLDHQNNQTKMN